ncbi:unnamed protein product [Gordionus sp. m RMFG-2023]
MKIYTPEISWHACDAIYSVDFDPLFSKNIFATCGLDHYIRIWLLEETNNDKDLKIEFLSELNRHQKPVNIVRYSPDGNFIASGDDEGIIFIWKRLPTRIKKVEYNVSWSVYRTLRAHLHDICDISWSPDNQSLFSGSQDKTCIIWDISKGVAWDPLNKYIVSFSQDRTCRVINLKSKTTVYKIVKKNAVSWGNQNIIKGDMDESKHKINSAHFFQDENMKSFFRRLTFTPFGELLLIPAGCIETGKQFKPVTYIFSRNNMKMPVAYIPNLNRYSSVVKCCPIIFKLRNLANPQNTCYINLPYRIVFAIACDNALSIHDTQQLSPILMIKDLHYWWISDLSWSRDGLTLIATSTDGYLSIINFEKFELGEPYSTTDITINKCLNLNKSFQECELEPLMSRIGLDHIKNIMGNQYNCKKDLLKPGKLEIPLSHTPITKVKEHIPTIVKNKDHKPSTIVKEHITSTVIKDQAPSTIFGENAICPMLEDSNSIIIIDQITSPSPPKNINNSIDDAIINEKQQLSLPKKRRIVPITLHKIEI